jgi:hypothetical protein
MNDTVRQFRDFFVSLKLTVVLLVLGMVLVFFATLYQVNLGIWAVQEKWFRSFIVLHRVGDIPVPVFPGGYFIGGLLLINLISAHIYRFKLTWRKAGIQLTHIGLILLLVGELLSGLWQEDYSMRLERGVPKNYSESYRDNELAIVDITDPATDEHVVIPEPLLARGETVQHPSLPFRVITKDYFPNSRLRQRGPVVDANTPSPATAGVGPRFVATPAPITYRQDARNYPTAYVELVGPEGSLGTWLTSQAPFDEEGHIISPQRIEHNGRTYLLSLRSTRSYKPFTLTLLKFSHDRYAGTEIPKNFSSNIRLQTPDGTDREVLIYMNNPLRYAGLTFYQASFERENPNVTILQVVRNPSWLIPYVACALMSGGLLWQFGFHLFGFVGRRRALRPSLA